MRKDQESTMKNKGREKVRASLSNMTFMNRKMKEIKEFEKRKLEEEIIRCPDCIIGDFNVTNGRCNYCHRHGRL